MCLLIQIFWKKIFYDIKLVHGLIDRFVIHTKLVRTFLLTSTKCESEVISNCTELCYIEEFKDCVFKTRPA